MANKYLDGAGLDHMWDKIKSYLTSNYAAKSHTHTIAQITNLQTTLNGKANSSHTHTSSQITDLSSKGYLKANSSLGTISFSSSAPAGFRINIPDNVINQITFISRLGDELSSYYSIYLPSGGTYLVYTVQFDGMTVSVIANKLSGGSTIGLKSKGMIDGFFVIRIP